MKSFLKELRDAAGQCPDILIRKLCKDIADEIHMLVLSLHACPTADIMRQLNAAWVRGVNVLSKAQPAPTNGPKSGSADVEEMERMAA